MERLEQYKYSADLAKRLRSDSGKTLAETAELAGVSKSTWQTYEQQKRAIDVDIVERFCKKAGLKPEKYVKAALEGQKKLKRIDSQPAADEHSLPVANDLKQYRHALGWTLDDATEYLGISRVPLVRAEADVEPDGERGKKGEKIRAQYHGIFVRARQQAKALVEQHRQGESDFVIEVNGLCIVPVFTSTQTLQEFLPQLKGTGETAAYYRYVAWLVFVSLLELGKSARLFEFADEHMDDTVFKKDVSMVSLRVFLTKLRWA